MQDSGSSNTARRNQVSNLRAAIWPSCEVLCAKRCGQLTVHDASRQVWEHFACKVVPTHTGTCSE